MNRIELTGRLTKDPELRYTENNLAICNFTIAVQRNFANASGEYEADFLMCKAFKKRAETIAKYCEKGDMVGVSGSIRVSKYEKDGKTNYITEIMADTVDFLSPKQNTPVEEKQAEIEPKNEENDLSDDVFAQFGDSLENFDDDGIAF